MDLSPVLTPVRDIGEFIREQRTSAQISIRALAARSGVSNPYLSQVERGLRRPSAEILAQIAHALSISVESLLARAGILEMADVPDVVCAINSDEVLTERHKAALVDIYAAFRSEALAAAGPAAPQAPEADPVGPADPADPAALPDPAHQSVAAVGLSTSTPADRDRSTTTREPDVERSA